MLLFVAVVSKFLKVIFIVKIKEYQITEMLFLILILKLYGEKKKLKINYIFLKDTYKTSFLMK